MVRVHADLVALLGEGVFAVLDRPQLVVRLQVRPAPESAVNHMRQTLAANTLNAVIADTAWARPAKEQVKITLLSELQNEMGSNRMALRSHNLSRKHKRYMYLST